MGGWATDWTNDVFFGEWIIPRMRSILENVGCADWLTGLVVDGIIDSLFAPLGWGDWKAAVATVTGLIFAAVLALAGRQLYKDKKRGKLPVAEYCTPAFTTINQNRIHIGKAAFSFFPPFYLTACVRSFLSAALFGCIFSIVKKLAIIGFTQLIFHTPIKCDYK